MAVYDALNFARNAITAAQMVQQIQLYLRDLAPLANMGAALQVAQDLAAVLNEVEAVAARISSRRHLWSAPYVMDSVQALAAFRSSSNQLCRATSQDALAAQSLIDRASRLLNTLRALIDSLSALAGTVSGLQTASASLGSLSGQMALLGSLQAGNNEASLCAAWATQVRREGVERLQQRLMQDWGLVKGR
jgi:hypothetical protein